MNIAAQAKRQISLALGKLLLSADAQAVQADHLTYLHPFKIKRLEKLAKQAASSVDGNFAEFGIALGGSAILLAKQARRCDRSFHGFDVFDMIPPPASEKDGEDAKSRYSIIAARKSKGLGDQEYYGYRSDLYGDVCRAFERHDIPVNDQTIQLHQGLFEDTLADFPDTPIAFAHIDCDWYDPVKLCLEQTHHRSVAGTIMLIDDYHDYEGCKTATDEFLAAHPEYELEMGPNVALIKNA